jgi:hypothetical protein
MAANPTSAPLETVTTNVAETAQQSTSALMESFNMAFGQIIQLAPKVLAMIVVLVVGYIIAKLVGKAITAVSERLGLHRAAERGGLVQSMQQVGIKRTVPQIIGAIVFWFLMFVFLMAGLNILGLEQVSAAVGQVVDYIPNLLVATVMVVVGLMLANFLRGVVATGADRVGISYASQLASGTYYVLVLMICIAAFEQLKIEFGPLNHLILIAFGAVAIAFGLSVGLGGREVVAGILSGYYIRQRMTAGDKVSVAGLEGTVRDVGPVATIIETEEDGMIHRHSVPNVKMLQEAVR